MDYRVVLLIGAFVIALFPGNAGAQEGDATAGATVFKKCATCHVADTDTNKVGPSLNKLFGRKAGTHPNFAYSAGMKAAYARVVSSGTRQCCATISTIRKRR